MPQLAEKADFIGRRPEIAELEDLLAAAVTGEGQIILISGEAGIGKTRLITELKSRPISQRFNWLNAQCIYQEGTDPYLPFFDALKDWSGSDTAAQEKPSLDTEASSGPEKYSINDLAKIPIIGPKLTEDPSLSFGSFMIKEPKSEFSLGVFSALVDLGRRGLCITRMPLEKLGSLAQKESVAKFWLSSKPGKHSISPSLTKISHEISQFVKFHPNSVIMLDGLEYLISHIEFNNVLKFVNGLVDSMAMYKSILLIPINPLTVEAKQLALLERDMNTIEIPDKESIGSAPTHVEINAPKDQTLNEEMLQQGRDRIFETITQQISDIAKVKPVILFIDDLHWADKGALYLLHYLARAMQNRPVAIIGTYRPEEVENPVELHPLRELLNRLVPEKLVKLISMKRLDYNETHDMIRSLLHNTKFPVELGELIFKETEGNPFFIEELLRSLEEEIVITYEEDQTSWSLTRKIPEISLPDTIKGVIEARINRLVKSMRLVLERASVLGVEFEYDILSAVSAPDESLLVTNLDDLIRLKFLSELPTKPGKTIQYRFVHNKICEVLYRGLSESHKRLLHTKTAKAIEENYQNDPDAVIYELAQHYYHGGDFNRALEYTMKAGEKALRSFAPEKARTFYQWGLASIDVLESQTSDTTTTTSTTTSYKGQFMDILLKQSEICLLIGEWDEALMFTHQLLKLSDELGDKRRSGDAYNYAGLIHSNRSAWVKAIDHFNKALSLADEIKYNHGVMEAYHGLGFVHERIGKTKKAMEYFKHFTQMASTMNSQTETARGYSAFARIFHTMEEYSLALVYYQKCIELLTDTDNYSELAKAYTNMGITYFELNEFDKVIEWNEKCIELSNRTGNIRLLGYGYSNAVEVYAYKKELDKAQKYADKALEIFKKLDEKSMIALVWMNYGIIFRNRQNWDNARYYFEKSLALLKDLKIPSFQADATRQYGLMLAEQGTAETIVKGQRFLQQALDIYKQLGATKYIDLIETELNISPPK